MSQDSPQAANTPVPGECNANDAQGCTETFVYRQDGVPLELLYTPAKNNITQRYWYETDAHGSVVALTDAAGNVVDHYAYLGPWGDLDPLHSAELVPQPLRYRGYVYDRELTGRGEASGWYWLGVRSYDPSIGRSRAGTRQPDPGEQEGTRSYIERGCHRSTDARFSLRTALDRDAIWEACTYERSGPFRANAPTSSTRLRSTLTSRAIHLLIPGGHHLYSEGGQRAGASGLTQSRAKGRIVTQPREGQRKGRNVAWLDEQACLAMYDGIRHSPDIRANTWHAIKRRLDVYQAEAFHMGG